MSDIPLLLGHRGARAFTSVPENSFASFDLAIEHGCDGFEFDVRLTGCGRALVCHNPKVGGVTVSRARAHQLRDLPQLEEVMERYGNRVFLDVELKVRGLEAKVLAALRSYRPQRDYVISSFIADVVLELKTRSAAIPLGIICEKATQLARWPGLPVDYVIAHQSLVDEQLIGKVHKAGRRLFTWTVNERTGMLRAAELGAEGIISDETELLVNTLRPNMD
jgi:glycerophosphoryl diester phosphodiesterase